MIDEFQRLIGYQAQAMAILNKSKMPIEETEKFTDAARDMLVVGLNITTNAFELNEDEQMALLTLIVVKSLEVTK